MVQIALAEQGRFKKESPDGVPLIEGGSAILGPIRGDGTLDDRIVIDAMSAGKFACHAIKLKDPDDCETGWEIEVGAVDEERAAALQGVVPNCVCIVSGDSGLVELTVNDFANEEHEKPAQFATYQGPIEELRWHRAEQAQAAA